MESLSSGVSPKLNARSLLLDLLRASEPDAWPVRVLVEVGALFGITENALRVNITRLVNRGLLSQDSRGYYRLGPKASPVRQWVNAWSLGEERVVDWRGGWLTVGIASAPTARSSAPLPRSLLRLGFRDLMDRYWVRPDNLAVPGQQLFSQIVELSGSQQFVMANANNVCLGEDVPPLESLWPISQLESQYRQHLACIQRSTEELRKAPIEQVLKDTFLYGGDVIRSLALDPLLPAEMVDTSLRAALTEAMRDYDQVFRRCWRDYFGVERLNRPGMVAH